MYFVSLTKWENLSIYLNEGVDKQYARDVVSSDNSSYVWEVPHSNLGLDAEYPY